MLLHNYHDFESKFYEKNFFMYKYAIKNCHLIVSGEYVIVKILKSFVNISVGDLALCNNRYNGNQYENDEALGDFDHIF